MSDPAMSGERPSQPSQQIQIKVEDGERFGRYANFLVVSHSAHEFTLDFCQVMPGGEPGRVNAEVVSRVKIAPTMVGKVITALNTNMTSYEDKFGLVREVG